MRATRDRFPLTAWYILQKSRHWRHNFKLITIRFCKISTHSQHQPTRRGAICFWINCKASLIGVCFIWRRNVRDIHKNVQLRHTNLKTERCSFLFCLDVNDCSRLDWSCDNNGGQAVDTGKSCECEWRWNRGHVEMELNAWSGDVHVHIKLAMWRAEQHGQRQTLRSHESGPMGRWTMLVD